VLGILEDSTFEEETVPLRPGDVVVVYSDGISDAMNLSDERFGEERLEAVIRANLGRPASALKDAILTAVRDHVGTAPTHDDMTLVVVKRLLAS
jgi:sigma-B regulation protein RsbU (phosphoserine phosphatase)